MYRFKLLERIGKGGYSEVFRTLDQQTGRLCALKVMQQPYHLFRGQQDLELTVLNQFKGTTGIIQLIDSFVEDGYLVLVFQLMQQSLIEFYRRVQTEECRPLAVAQIKSILVQLALAIEALHSQGYAHRDLKPENILVDRLGDQLTVKLVDFGLTKKLLDGRNTNYVATRWYRAPEILLSMPYHASVDMFAMGCLMAQLYCRREVFRGVSSLDQLSEIFNWLGTPTPETWPQGAKQIQTLGVSLPLKQPKSLRSLALGIDDQGADLLSKLLVLDPKKRITSTEMLRHPYFNSVGQELPSAVLRQLVLRSTVVPKPQKKFDFDFVKRKQLSQPKLGPNDSNLSTAEPARSSKPDRPVSMHYSISAVKKRDNLKPTQALSHRLSIVYRQKNSADEPVKEDNAEEQVTRELKSLVKESIKLNSRLTDQLNSKDNSFIRSKLKMDCVSPRQPLLISSVATNSGLKNDPVNRNQSKPHNASSSTQQGPKNSMDFYDQRRYQSIDKVPRPTFQIDSGIPADSELPLKQMISTDRLSIKKPPSLKKLFPYRDTPSQSQQPTRVNNNSVGGYLTLNESIASKTRYKVNSILLNYRAGVK